MLSLNIKVLIGQLFQHLELTVQLIAFQIIDFRLVQPTKTFSNDVIFFGISIDVSPVQPRKACNFIVVTLLGISIEVSLFSP